MGEKKAVALVIFRDESREEIVSVLRPEEDQDHPGAWGLPATSLKEGEDWEDAVHRAAENKLGVDVSIEGLMSEGGQARDEYGITLRNYRVEIESGEVEVDRGQTEGTDYVEWSWRPPNALRDTAEDSESLCTTLLLDYMDYRFDKPHNIFKMLHDP